MRAFILTLALALTPLAAQAQTADTDEQTGKQTGEQTGEQAGERFFVALPQQWTEVARSRQQGAKVVAYVPQGQTAEAWTDMLSLQVYPEMTALPARAFYERSLKNVQDTCDNPQAGALQTGLSNDYPAAFWVLGCGLNRAIGRGETSFFRLIQGDGGLYMAQRTWRTDPYLDGSGPGIPAQAHDQAIELLSSFGVCDPTDPDHPCPDMGASTPQ